MMMTNTSHTTPQASPVAASSSTAAAYRPSPSSGTPSSSSSSKPRLLYRGPLRLSDGTLLNGVAFVSTVDPFEKGVGEGGGAGGAAGADDADICLALEMARGQRCLSIESLNDGLASTSAPALPLKPSSSNNFAAGGAGTGWDVQLEASGKIRMYIDPNEPLTAAFFERNFCCGGEGWDAESGKERSRTAFLISTGPSIPATTTTTIAVPQAGSSQAQHDDVFTNSYTTAPSSSAMAAPLPLVERRSAALQLVLFARMSENSTDGVLEIVVGRRVAQRRRATGGPKGEMAAPGGIAAAPRRASQGVRPDDPLPRVAGAVVGQKVKQPEIPGQPAPAGPSTWRKTASAPNLARPSPVPPPARGVAKASAEGGADTSLMSVKEEDDDGHGQAAAASSSRATSAAPRGSSVTGGNHTPGRRGEKRRSTTTATATAKQQQQRSQEHLLLSPTSSYKRRRTALAPTSAALSKGSAPSSSSFSGVAAPPRPESLPLQPLQPPQPRTRRDAASPTPGLDVPPLSATFAPPKASSSSTSTGYNAIETKNRAMIKKLVQHQLLGRGLERRRPAGPGGGQGGDAREGSVDPTLADEDVAPQDANDRDAAELAGEDAGDEEDEEEDFDRLFLGAYTSTCVALRKDLHKKTVRRDVAARVVRWHLDLYLEDRDCAMTGGGGGGGGAAAGGVEA